MHVENRENEVLCKAVKPWINTLCYQNTKKGIFLKLSTLILWKGKLDAPMGTHVLILPELKNTHQATANFEVFLDVADQARAGDFHLR